MKTTTAIATFVGAALLALGATAQAEPRDHRSHDRVVDHRAAHSQRHVRRHHHGAPTGHVYIDGRWRPRVHDQVWVEGYWQARGDRYVWVEGYWAQPQPGYVWQPAEWVRTGGKLVLIPGQWVAQR